MPAHGAGKTGNVGVDVASKPSGSSRSSLAQLQPPYKHASALLRPSLTELSPPHYSGNESRPFRFICPSFNEARPLIAYGGNYPWQVNDDHPGTSRAESANFGAGRPRPMSVRKPFPQNWTCNAVR